MSSFDETLKCCDCNADFVYTEKDAAFFESKGFAKPKRCYNCRQQKKARMAARQGNPK